MKNITETIKYIGADDTEIDLFENQYIVPEGMAYNSYVILDDKVTVMDTADLRVAQKWEQNLVEALGGRKVDYLVIQHMEPDHTGAIKRLTELYPEVTLVGNAKTFTIMDAFYEIGADIKRLTVNDGDKLCLGSHTLNFVFAPMVHWPEVMLTYEETEKVLFSADAFGKFGALCNESEEEGWACEARRYYFNIVGKYGSMVQALLKKAAGLEINTICPLHGPILTENLGYYIGLYDTWSSYKAETEGVFIACASIHGNTMKAAEKMEEILKAKGVTKVVLTDICRADIAEVIEDAFRYDRIILAASSYDGGVFAPMSDLLHHLASKGYQNRKIGIIENGSWGPTAARTMKGILEGMKNMNVVSEHVTIRSSLKDSDIPKLEALADEMAIK